MHGSDERVVPRVISLLAAPMARWELLGNPSYAEWVGFKVGGRSMEQWFTLQRHLGACNGGSCHGASVSTASSSGLFAEVYEELTSLPLTPTFATLPPAR